MTEPPARLGFGAAFAVPGRGQKTLRPVTGRQPTAGLWLKVTDAAAIRAAIRVRISPVSDDSDVG